MLRVTNILLDSGCRYTATQRDIATETPVVTSVYVRAGVLKCVRVAKAFELRVAGRSSVVWVEVE